MFERKYLYKYITRLHSQGGRVYGSLAISILLLFISYCPKYKQWYYISLFLMILSLIYGSYLVWLEEYKKIEAGYDLTDDEYVVLKQIYDANISDITTSTDPHGDNNTRKKMYKILRGLEEEGYIKHPTIAGNVGVLAIDITDKGSRYIENRLRLD